MPKVRQIMRKLSKIGGKYDCMKVNPHFTLMTTFKTSKIAEIIKEIKKQHFKKFTITLQGPLLFSKNFVWFRGEKKAMHLIHKKVIEIVSRYKSSWVLSYYKKIKLDKKQKGYLKQYSFPYAREYFLPHMALAGFNFSDDKMPKIKESIKKQVKIKMPIRNIYILTKRKNNWYIYKKIKLLK